MAGLHASSLALQPKTTCKHHTCIGSVLSRSDCLLCASQEFPTPYSLISNSGLVSSEIIMERRKPRLVVSMIPCCSIPIDWLHNLILLHRRAKICTDQPKSCVQCVVGSCAPTWRLNFNDDPFKLTFTKSSMATSKMSPFRL